MRKLFAILFLLAGVNLQAAINGEFSFPTLFGMPLELVVTVFFAILFAVVIALVIEPVEE